MLQVLLSIISGVSKLKISSPVSITAFTSLGSWSLNIPDGSLGFGKLIPSLKRESIVVKAGKPSLESTRTVWMEGTSAFNTDLNVFALKVNSFTSEKSSSLGTYSVLLLLDSDKGSVPYDTMHL